LADHLKALEEDGFIRRSTQHLGKGNGSRTSYTLYLETLKVAPADFAGAEVAPATFDSCTGSGPHVTNHQEPTVVTIAEAIVDAKFLKPIESKSTGKARGAARRSKLPKDWTPNIANLAYASKNGLTREEINHEADQFRNHAAAQGRLAANWDAAFRTWLGNTVKWRAERAASSAARAKPGGQSRSGGIFAAGVRAVSEARGYGQPVRDEDERRRGNDDMGAGHDIDGEFFRITGT
jgi:hypothetical protein